MAKCACGKHEISQEKADRQRAQAQKQYEEAVARAQAVQAEMNRTAEAADFSGAPSGVSSAHSGCGCGCAGVAAQGGLGLRAASAAPGARPVDQSGGRRMLGLRGI